MSAIDKMDDVYRRLMRPIEEMDKANEWETNVRQSWDEESPFDTDWIDKHFPISRLFKNTLDVEGLNSTEKDTILQIYDEWTKNVIVENNAFNQLCSEVYKRTSSKLYIYITDRIKDMVIQTNQPDVPMVDPYRVNYPDPQLERMEHAVLTDLLDLSYLYAIQKKLREFVYSTFFTPYTVVIMAAILRESGHVMHLSPSRAHFCENIARILSPDPAKKIRRHVDTEPEKEHTNNYGFVVRISNASESFILATATAMCIFTEVVDMMATQKHLFSALKIAAPHPDAPIYAPGAHDAHPVTSGRPSANKPRDKRPDHLNPGASMLASIFIAKCMLKGKAPEHDPIRMRHL